MDIAHCDSEDEEAELAAALAISMAGSSRENNNGESVATTLEVGIPLKVECTAKKNRSVESVFKSSEVLTSLVSTEPSTSVLASAEQSEEISLDELPETKVIALEEPVWNLKIPYAKKDYKISIACTKTIGSLKDELEPLINCASAFQKLTFKGNKFLTADKVKFDSCII